MVLCSTFVVVTTEEFRAFFEQFGPVMDSIVMVDKNTMRSRGFGFVTFENAETSHMLLAMGNSNEASTSSSKVGRVAMRGKMIEVKSAEPKESAQRKSDRYNQGVMFPGRTHLTFPMGGDPTPFPPPDTMIPFVQPACYAPGVVFAGYPMYYPVPGPVDPTDPPVMDAIPGVHPPYVVEGSVPAFFFPTAPHNVVSAPVPPSAIVQPTYPFVTMFQEGTDMAADGYENVT
jgi:RNA recognition motif-containing protein